MSFEEGRKEDALSEKYKTSFTDKENGDNIDWSTFDENDIISFYLI